MVLPLEDNLVSHLTCPLCIMDQTWCHAYPACEETEARESKLSARGDTPGKDSCVRQSPGREASLLPPSTRKPSWRSVLESRDPVTHFETLCPVTSSVGSPSSGAEQVFPQRDSSDARPGKGGAPPISFSPPPPGVVMIWIRPLITGFILHWF